MKAAVLILAHNNPKQLNRLIKRMQHENIDIFIHIDKKNEHIISEINVSCPNVSIVKENVKVYWGTFSQVQASMNSLKEAYERGEYDYFILLSGQDYPLKNTEYITNFLEANRGKCFLDYRRVEKDGWGSERLSKYYLIGLRELFNRLFYNTIWFGKRIPYKITQTSIGFLENIITYTAKILGKNPLNFFNMQLYGGSQWWILTKEAVEYIFDFINQQPAFVKGMRRSLIPDELFFQTILVNSNMAGNIINNGYRYIEIQEGQFHPKTLTCRDFQKIIKTQGLFARKFSDDVDEEILDMIDSYLGSKSDTVERCCDGI